MFQNNNTITSVSLLVATRRSNSCQDSHSKKKIRSHTCYVQPCLYQASALSCHNLFYFSANLCVFCLKGQRSVIFHMITWAHGAFYISLVKNEWPQNCREVNLVNNLRNWHRYIEPCSISSLPVSSRSLSRSLSAFFWQRGTSIRMSLPTRSCLNKVIGFDL